MIYIKGNFKKYIFRSSNGYTVGIFHVKESNTDINTRTVTFTGYLPELNEFDIYKFEGDFSVHDKYGKQFNVTSFEVIIPDDDDNIISFLSSELFKGIGESKAKSIVSALGNNCLNIILDNPESLDDVPGLSIKQKETIYNALLDYNSSYERMLSLTKVGFSVKNAVKIDKFYGVDTNFMLEHPYNMIDDIEEITFPIVDRIRNNLGISNDDIDRVSYGIVYAMENLSFRTGNIYFSYDELVMEACKLLFVEASIISDGIANLVTIGKLIIDDDKYVLTDIYNSNIYIAKRILDLSFDHREDSYDEEISSLEDKLGYSFNDEQKKAITNALNYNFSVITGGPGTGKTTIIKAIASVYKDINRLIRGELCKDLILLAPTGRASKRMSNQSGLPSYTIHRFLKWQKDNNKFMINEENKSDAKLVIIDEASMVDENLLYNLFLGLKSSCKIVMIGDYNQLPSVGPGEVLKDIIESGSTIVTYLEKLYRQDSKSNINFLAKDIISGIVDFKWFNNSDDLTFVPCNEEEVADILSEFLNTYKDLSIYDLQVLAPLYKGECGIDNLNDMCQKLLNTGSLKSEIVHNGIHFKENDKVINLVNNLDDNVFNGDIGEVFNIIGKGKKKLICDFDGNITEYENSALDNVRLGYVISIHKAQGSEFDVVIIPVLKSYNYMLYRKLIYTAVTRAKKKLILIGEEDALKKAILTDRDDNRKTLLGDFLKNGISL